MLTKEQVNKIKNMSKITIYTTPTCAYCKVTKAFSLQESDKKLCEIAAT